eukprot:2913118-Amphidinium_carterae.1
MAFVGVAALARSSGRSMLGLCLPAQAIDIEKAPNQWLELKDTAIQIGITGIERISCKPAIKK